MGVKSAFVTGGAARLGKAVAIELARLGYHIVLHFNHSADKARLVKEEIEAMGAQCSLVQFDFLADNDYYSLLNGFKSKGYDLQVLVNSASEFVPSSLDDVGNEMLHRQMRINFESAYMLTKAFARVVDCGVVINFLDTKITKNQSRHIDYILAKKLLKEFTYLTAVHYAPQLRVNAVAPGLVLPPAGEDVGYLQKLAENIPLKRHGGVDDILKAVRFLLDSQFITGQVIYVDGGDHLT